MARLSAEEMFKNMIGRKDEEPQPAIRPASRANAARDAVSLMRMLFFFIMFSPSFL